MSSAISFLFSLLLQLILGVLGIPWESDKTRDLKASSPQGIFILGLILAIAVAGTILVIRQL